MQMLEISYLVSGAVGLGLGGVIGGLWASKKAQSAIQSQHAENQLLSQQLEQSQVYHDQQVDQLNNTLMQSRQQLEQLQQQANEYGQKAALVPDLMKQRDTLSNETRTQQQTITDLRAEFESTKSALSEIQKAHQDKVKLMEDTEKRLQTQFENLANKIFEQKSESFSKMNKTGLDALLNPLKEQIEGFKKQVTDQYVREGQERASLKTEILGLKELNRQITTEAAALTQALKGDNKQQGNWGEVVLERILKESGLREGHEFDTQVSVRTETGKLQQPDVVVHLPNDKDVIIDSKVSLASYERYFNSADDAEREVHLKEHVNSLRAHIKGLGKKEYHDLKELRTLDYVLMFIPVEPAFLLAVDADPELVNLALNSNIMLVSPTNLLVALRTINNIWQYEYQNQNAQEIAAHASKLYDKFAGFVTDMEKIGRALDTTQKSFDSAFSKLSTGRGNIVRQIEQFRKLGVQPNKRLPDNMITDD